MNYLKPNKLSNQEEDVIELLYKTQQIIELNSRTTEQLKLALDTAYKKNFILTIQSLKEAFDHVSEANQR